MWYKTYIKRKYQWVKDNPVASSWIGFVKGVVYTVLVYEVFLK